MHDTTAINSRKALQEAVAVRESGAEQTKEFRMNDTHAKMALDYGIDIIVAAAELVKFDMMGSALRSMELQTKKPAIAETVARNSEW